MIEVEAKIRIDNPKEIRKKISKIAKYDGKYKKVDHYYTLESLKKYPKKCLRIRKNNKDYEVNIKKKVSKLEHIHAKNEVEFNIRDIKTFLDLIKDFGFKKWIAKYKTTYNYEINKRFHIEVNHVRKLGWFLEVEYLAKRGEIPKARKKVLEIVKKLGFDKKKIIEDGYTKMLWDLK